MSTDNLIDKNTEVKDNINNVIYLSDFNKEISRQISKNLTNFHEKDTLNNLKQGDKLNDFEIQNILDTYDVEIYKLFIEKYLQYQETVNKNIFKEILSLKDESNDLSFLLASKCKVNRFQIMNIMEEFASAKDISHIIKLFEQKYDQLSDFSLQFMIMENGNFDDFSIQILIEKFAKISLQQNPQKSPFTYENYLDYLKMHDIQE